MAPRPEGILIAIEGIDGTGKSHLARSLTTRLREDGDDVVLLSEPTTGSHGTRIRALTASAEDRPTPEEELTLFMDDRREDVERNIAPALAQHKIVLMDRYYFSTMAYQGARGIDPAAIAARHAGWAPTPRLTIILTAPVAVCLRRVTEIRGDRPTAFEQTAYLETVQALFEGFNHPSIHRIDADRPFEAVFQEVYAAAQTALHDTPAA